MTRAALECEQWWVMPPSLPTRGWHENREPLALFLSDDEWRMLAAAFEEMRITNDVLSGLYADLSEHVELGWVAPVRPGDRACVSK